MMPAKPITSSQKKRIRGLISDNLHQSFNGVDKETAQRIIEAGDKLPEAIKLALLKLGRKPDDARVKQARVWWDKVISRAIKPGFTSFEAYLVTVPEIPEVLQEEDLFLPLLTLGDSNVPRTERAKLIGVKHAEFGYDNNTLVPFDARHEIPRGPFWFRAHDGRVNNGKKPTECRDACVGKLLAGTADIGLALLLQHPDVAVEGEHAMDLPGSVHRGDRAYCSYLKVWDGSPKLNVHLGDDAGSFYGTVVFRRE